jgi:hypothetical protein
MFAKRIISKNNYMALRSLRPCGELNSIGIAADKLFTCGLMGVYSRPRYLSQDIIPVVVL